MYCTDPDGLRLPVKLDTTSNGEFVPLPLDPLSEEVNRVARKEVGVIAKRLDLLRRAYLVSTCGAAAVFDTMNQVFSMVGKKGGRYELPKEAVYEEEAADSALRGDEFIFDVQLHHVNPNGTWRKTSPRWENALSHMVEERGYSGPNKLQCLDAKHLVKEVFFDSDTTCAVLSAVPAAPENPLLVEEAADTRALVEEITGFSRLLIHGMSLPNLPGSIEGMEAVQREFNVAAWKTYTQWGPDGKGYWLDDEDTGIRMIEKVRELGVNIVCVHKGIPIGEIRNENSGCRDIGVVARRYPDVKFLVYHSGYEPLIEECAYSDLQPHGINSLIQSLRDNGIQPGGNVYAELGSTWRFLMRDPDQAAHALGKLINAVGEDNVLWGTDCIWYGSPQDQIQAFRAFSISREFQEHYDYPELTPSIKRKIFGLNSARVYSVDPAEMLREAKNDHWGKAKAAYLPNQDPSFLTYGPQTQKEFFAQLNAHGGLPA